MAEEESSGITRRSLLKGFLGAIGLGLTARLPEAKAQPKSVEEIRALVDNENQAIGLLVEPFAKRLEEAGTDSTLINEIHEEVQALEDQINPHTQTRFQYLWALIGRDKDLPATVFLREGILNVLHLSEHPEVEHRVSDLEGHLDESVRSVSSQFENQITPFFVSNTDGIRYSMRGMQGDLDIQTLSFGVGNQYRVDGWRIHNEHLNVIVATDLVPTVSANPGHPV